MDKKQNMTNKALLGLVGGGSAAAGLGAGYGVGVNNKPFDYRNFMNVFYANLIEDAKAKVNAYKNETDEGEKTKMLKSYKEYVCDIATGASESYSGAAKKRLEEDKALCGESNFDQTKWENHFKKWPQDLKEEWDDFVKHVYGKPPSSQ